MTNIDRIRNAPVEELAEMIGKLIDMGDPGVLFCKPSNAPYCTECTDEERNS